MTFFYVTGYLQDAWQYNEDARWWGNAREANKQDLSTDGHECRRPAVSEGVHRRCNEWPDNCAASAVRAGRSKGRWLVRDVRALCVFFTSVAACSCLVLHPLRCLLCSYFDAGRECVPEPCGCKNQLKCVFIAPVTTLQLWLLKTLCSRCVYEWNCLPLPSM